MKTLKRINVTGWFLIVWLIFLNGCVCQINMAKGGRQYGNASSSEKTVQDALELLKRIETLLTQKESVDKADLAEVKEALIKVKELINRANITAETQRAQK